MSNPKFIIEIVGIAGAGKTTLCQFLKQRNKRIEFRFLPHKLIYLPFLIRTLIVWLPVYFCNCHNDRWLTWKEVKIMGYLDTWISYLKKRALRRNIICVLEPGSVYWLAALRKFGPQFVREKKCAKWWDEKLQNWRKALNLIVWLDAPDEVLIQRVKNRKEWHEAKDKPVQAVLEEFSRLREEYSRIVNLMIAEGGPQMLNFRTDQLSSEEIGNRVFKEAKLYEA
jgi:shikimate kinase